MMKEVSMKDIEEMNQNYIEAAVSDTKKATHILIEQLNLSDFKVVDKDKVRIYDHNASTREISKAFALNDVEIIAIGKNTETLEDYFLKLTGGEE